jgi:catechol 2,3-dioxygenase-like lactoylglutathione lyase family enzyme
MAEKIIYGIQQIGVGVPDAYEAFNWYGKVLGADLMIFDDDNVATYMAPYMGGSPHKKRAILSANIQGGAAYEIWQFMDRTPEAPKEEISLGDLGIYSMKVKAKDINDAYNTVKSKGAKMISGIQSDPNGTAFFFIEDPYGNKIQIVHSQDWFTQKSKYVTGAIHGCIIGVSSIEKAKLLYSDILGYDKVIYDKTGSFSDLNALKGGKNKFRRVLLTHSKARTGGISPLLGSSQLELVEVQDRTPTKIYKDRYWGDIGLIHLCFDVSGMEPLKNECAAKGFPFTIDSTGEFKMGEAAGHWCYTEDPDGTLIEFVETYKLPILKKFNWYLDLKKRDQRKSLPRWIMKSLAFNRVKIK